MANRSVSGWLTAIVFLGVMVGIVGGGLMGGVVGFYVASSRPPVLAPAAVTVQPLATAPVQAPPAVTNVTLNETSAVIDTVKKVEPAVVTVLNTLDHPTGPFGRIAPTASGSGVIIDNQGHIITNNHVVDGAKQIEVIFNDGSKSQAVVVGGDPVSDIAVIQVSGSVPASVDFGDSNGLQLGETVIAIGSPLGSYRGSVTVGVVSGLNRSVAGTGQDGLIQTDAAINHGNSGGPLVNVEGQIVGINTIVVRDTTSGDIAEGLGFAVPSNTARDVVQQILGSGKVDYPFIGIRYQEITPQIANQNSLPTTAGILVIEVTPNSPAANAGIRLNDVIVALDTNKIDQEHSLRSILTRYHIGDAVTVQLLRNGQTVSVKVTLIARPAGS